MTKISSVISCEHASNRVPEAFLYLFSQAKEELKSHLGWDPGALFWAQQLAESLGQELYKGEYTRLLIELNRSLDNSQLFSKYSNNLSDSVKKYIIQTYYKPYRKQVTQRIDDLMQSSTSVVHLSMHSFTPVFHGNVREVEIGLLFDDDRREESDFCSIWIEHLKRLLPDVCIRFNEPYLGKDDGFCTLLRTKYADENYIGIELEVSQKFVDSGKERISEAICQSFKLSLDDYQSSRGGRSSG